MFTLYVRTYIKQTQTICNRFYLQLRRHVSWCGEGSHISFYPILILSIGLRSRGLASQGKTQMLLASRNCCGVQSVWHAWSLILCWNHVSVVQDEKDKNWSENVILIPSCSKTMMTRKSGVLCAQRLPPRSRYFSLHQICPCPQYKRRCDVLLAGEKAVFYRRDFVDLFWFVNKKERWPSQLS